MKHSNTSSKEYSENYPNKAKVSQAKLAVQKICDKCWLKIKKNPNADMFYYGASDAPSWSLIEKNIKQYKYNSPYDFLNDWRKLWSDFFQKYSTSPEIYQKAIIMSEYSEQTFKEIDAISEEKTDINELTKKLDSLQREVKGISRNQIVGSGGVMGNNALNKRSGGYSNDKPMTNLEKANLGKWIRTLNKEQLRGIIKLLSDSKITESKQKYFEFDIDTLPPKKLRELEKYVKNCTKTQGQDSSIQMKESNQKIVSEQISVNTLQKANGNQSGMKDTTKLQKIDPVNAIPEKKSFGWDSGSSSDSDSDNSSSWEMNK